MAGPLPDWQALAPGLESPALDAAFRAAHEGRGLIVVLSAPSAHDAGWASDLAIEIAQRWTSDDAPCCLVDWSLERPDLHRKLGAGLGEGIADCVYFGASRDRVVSPTSRGFDFISAGTVATDPEGLVTSPRWRGLRGQLARLGGLLIYAPTDLPGVSALAEGGDVVLLIADPHQAEAASLDLAGVPAAIFGRPLEPLEAVDAASGEEAHDARNTQAEQASRPEVHDVASGWELLEQPGLEDVLEEVDLDLVGGFAPPPGGPGRTAAPWTEPKEKPGGEQTPEPQVEDTSDAGGEHTAYPGPGEPPERRTDEPVESRPGPPPDDWFAVSDEAALTGGWDAWGTRMPPEEADDPETGSPVDPAASASGASEGGASQSTAEDSSTPKRGSVPPGWEREFDEPAARAQPEEDLKPTILPAFAELASQEEEDQPSGLGHSQGTEDRREGERAKADPTEVVPPAGSAAEVRQDVEALPLRKSRSPVPPPRREPEKSPFPLIRVLLLLVLLLLLLAVGMGWVEVPGLGAQAAAISITFTPIFRTSVSDR
jgi:hypothetical protein